MFKCCEHAHVEVHEGSAHIKLLQRIVIVVIASTVCRLDWLPLTYTRSPILQRRRTVIVINRVVCLGMCIVIILNIFRVMSPTTLRIWVALAQFKLEGLRRRVSKNAEFAQSV